MKLEYHAILINTNNITFMTQNYLFKHPEYKQSIFIVCMDWFCLVVNPQQQVFQHIM